MTTQSHRPQLAVRRVVIFLAAFAIAAAMGSGAAWPQAKPNKAKRTRPPTPVIVSRVAAVKQAPKLKYTGVMEPSVKAQLSSDVAGRVTEINSHLGDKVVRNEVLARLANPALELDLDVLRARVLEVEAVVAQSKQKLERTRKLFKKNLASAEVYDDAMAAYRVSQARLVSAKAQRKQLVQRLELMTIRSPIDGEVVQVELDLGQWVSPNVPLYMIYNYDQFEMRVGIPGKYLNRIRIGDAVGIVISEIGKSLTGSIVATVKHVSAKSGKFLLRILVENPHNEPLSGLLAEAHIPLGRLGSVVSVPRDAIVRRGGLSQVIVVRKGVAKVVKVEIAGDLGDAVMVKGGRLKVKDQVVVRGNERLFSGMKVKVTGTL